MMFKDTTDTCSHDTRQLSLEYLAASVEWFVDGVEVMVEGLEGEGVLLEVDEMASLLGRFARGSLPSSSLASEDAMSDIMSASGAALL